jgi:hypothetical protein
MMEMVMMMMMTRKITTTIRPHHFEGLKVQDDPIALMNMIVMMKNWKSWSNYSTVIIMMTMTTIILLKTMYCWTMMV